MDEYDDYEDGMDEEDGFGCCFPDKCVMPGYHLKSECHTAEMLEAYYEEILKEEE